MNTLETNTDGKFRANSLAKIRLLIRLFMAFSLCWLLIGRVDASQTRQSVAIDYLIGDSDIQGVRIAYRPLHTHYDDLFLFGEVELYWEVSVNFWEYGEDNQHEVNYAIALSPVLSWHLTNVKGKYPVYLEFGIGVSLVEDTRFAGKDIGSHYQFEDRIGVVTRFGNNNQQSFALRYMHYSNGGLNDNNPGVDFLNASYAFRF